MLWPSRSAEGNAGHSLKQRLTDFIDYFNAVLAKPFRWTYAGKPLYAA